MAAVEDVSLFGFVIQPTGLGLSSPPPASFAYNDANDTLDLSYSAGALPVGGQFQVSYNLRNGVPGDYTFTSRVLYTDGAGVRADRSTTAPFALCSPTVQYPSLLQ